MTGIGRKVWGAAAILCWLVALYLVATPVSVDLGGATMRCDRGFRAALSVSDGECAERARGRLNVLVFWIIFTAPVTLGFLVTWAAAKRPTGTE